jgi:antitoxin MazE
MRVQLVRIGNSRGLRVPKQILDLYRIGEGDELELEARPDGIMIKPIPQDKGKLSWADAYKEMADEAAESAEWSLWDATTGDDFTGDKNHD